MAVDSAFNGQPVSCVQWRVHLDGDYPAIGVCLAQPTATGAIQPELQNRNPCVTTDVHLWQDSGGQGAIICFYGSGTINLVDWHINPFVLLRRRFSKPLDPVSKSAKTPYHLARCGAANHLQALFYLPIGLFARQARHHRREHIDVLKENLQIRDAILFAPSLQRVHHLLNRADEQVRVV